LSREAAGLVMAAVAAVILLGMFFAWRARLRRDGRLTAPVGVPEHAEVTARHEVLYVATTKHDQPLERLAITPLVYRARGELALTDRGIALSLDGAPTVFLASSRLIAADRAMVTIDRVVEPGGLIRLVWNVSADTIADSFIRLTHAEPATILPQLQTLCAAAENGENS